MLDKDLQVITDSLYQRAAAHHVEYITLEHLLLALITDSKAVQDFLLAHGTSQHQITALRRELDIFTTDAVATVKYVSQTRPKLSTSYRVALELAEQLAQGQKPITPIDLLRAISRYRSQYGAQFLEAVIDVPL